MHYQVNGTSRSQDHDKEAAESTDPLSVNVKLSISTFNEAKRVPLMMSLGERIIHPKISDSQSVVGFIAVFRILRTIYSSAFGFYCKRQNTLWHDVY